MLLNDSRDQMKKVNLSAPYKGMSMIDDAALFDWTSCSINPIR
jgi:hypothetical protein